VSRLALGHESVSPVVHDRRAFARRRGVASLDYILVLGVILPLATFLLTVGPRIIRLAYEMVRVVVTWPWM
jgi:hypothetical protein